MSYYDPRIYNYANLYDEDKRTIAHMMETTRDALFEAHFDGVIQERHEKTLSKIVNGIRKDALEDAWCHYLCAIIDLMAATIDNYDHEVPMQDTDDYFFKCEVQDLFDDDEDEEEDEF